MDGRCEQHLKLLVLGYLVHGPLVAMELTGDPLGGELGRKLIALHDTVPQVLLGTTHRPLVAPPREQQHDHQQQRRSDKPQHDQRSPSAGLLPGIQCLHHAVDIGQTLLRLDCQTAAHDVGQSPVHASHLAVAHGCR